MNQIVLTLIIPAYNEKKSIAKIIEEVKKKVKYQKQIIVIDDFSNDGTTDIIKNLKGIDKSIFHQKNLGKGAAIKSAIPFIKGDLVAIQDADLEYDPEDINKLLKIALDEDKEFVIGYRQMKTSINHLYFYFRELAVNALTFTLNLLYNVKIRDCACCYRLFDTKLWQNIYGRADKFEYDFSIICQAVKKTKKIGQCKVYYNSRSYEDGKKCTWDVGIHAFKRIILDRFN